MGSLHPRAFTFPSSQSRLPRVYFSATITKIRDRFWAWFQLLFG
jgi:hypothetical protein